MRVRARGRARGWITALRIREAAADFASFCDTLAHEDERVLAELKEALCRGARVFETHGRDTVRHGQELLDALASIPPVDRGV